MRDPQLTLREREEQAQAQAQKLGTLVNWIAKEQGVNLDNKTYTSVRGASYKGVGEFYTYYNSASGRDYITRVPPRSVAAMVKAVADGIANKNQDVFVRNMAQALA